MLTNIDLNQYCKLQFNLLNLFKQTMPRNFQWAFLTTTFRDSILSFENQIALVISFTKVRLMFTHLNISEKYYKPKLNKEN